jgi:hypothetical protein
MLRGQPPATAKANLDAMIATFKAKGARVILAGMPALLALGYVRGWRAREGGYWLPYAVLGLVLVLGVRSVTTLPP